MVGVPTSKRCDNCRKRKKKAGFTRHYSLYQDPSAYFQAVCLNTNIFSVAKRSRRVHNALAADGLARDMKVNGSL